MFCLFLLTGCENNDFLQSESAVNAKLQGRWKMYGPSSVDPNQQWKMDNGVLTITTRIEGVDSTIDRGFYSVLTKVSKCYVTISGLTVPELYPSDLNTRWNIAELSGNVLYLCATNPGGSIISREFVKQ